MRNRDLLRILSTGVLMASMLMLALIIGGSVSAQQVSIATGLPSSASSGSSSAPSVVTFCINNNRSTAITLKGIDHYMSTSNANTVWKLYYSASSLSGTPNVTTWTFIDSVTGPTVTSTNIYGLFSSLSFSIPAATTYRFALQTTAGIINYGGATVTPNSQSIANIDLYRGNYTIGGSNVGYAGTASSPPFSPRFFCGTVYFDTAAAICTGTPTAAVISTPAMNPAAPVCAGSTKALSASHGWVIGISYQWQSGPSATGPWTNVSGGTGATTLSYTTGALAANTFFRVATTCSTSNLTTYSIPYQVLVGAPQPGAISGPPTFCPGNQITFSVPAVAGTTYTWTLPTGWTGSSTSSSISVTPNSTPGTISVVAKSACGTSISQSYTPLPGSAPSPPGLISGNDYICPNTTHTYSVAPVTGAFNYTWTLPSGWSGNSSTNTITATANTNSGSVTVRAVNGCGQSSVTSLPVSVLNSLASPGTITGPDSVCSGDLNTYSIVPVPGATSYVWILPSGWSGTTNGTSIQAFAGTSSGILRVTAYVSCAMSPVASKSISVVQTVNPAVTLSVPPGSFCQGSAITFTANSAFPGPSPGYQWKKNGIAVLALGNVYTTNTLSPGDSITVTMTSTASCASDTIVTSNSVSPTITPSVVPGVSINATPPIVVCSGTPVTFTTTSNGTGATPSYQWFKNGTQLPGATGTTYTDAGLVQGDTMTIQMTTSAACATIPTAGSNKVGVTVHDLVLPTVDIEVSPSEVVMPGQPLYFTATQSHGGPSPDYQWLRNGVIIPFETGDSYTSSTLQPGDRISVQMISYDPCASQLHVTSNEIVLKGTLGIAGASRSVGSVTIYPNPNSGRFTISAAANAGSTGTQIRLDVLNVLGQPVHHADLIPSGPVWKTQLELDSKLPGGHYLLRVSAWDGSLNATVPFILNK